MHARTSTTDRKADHDEVVTSLGLPSASFVQDRFYARAEYREFLHAVASPAPTCSLLPASVFPIIEDHLLPYGHINDFRTLQTFAADAAVLHSLLLALQRQEGGQLGVDGVRLIR